MNRRLGKFLMALSLCLLGLYFLVGDIFFHEVLFAPFVRRVPHVFVFVIGLGILNVGVRLARHAVLEELSVTSD